MRKLRFILVLLATLAALAPFSGATGRASPGPQAGGPASVAPAPCDPPSAIYSILGRSKNLTAKQWRSMVRWRESTVAFVAKHPGVYVNGSPADKTVCLTFDDGPDGKITPLILDTLEEQHAVASFFFVGNRLQANRAVVKRAYGDGNLILSHSWDHPRLILQKPGQVRDELKRTEDRLDEIIGVRPAMVRPPFGDIDGQVAKVFQDAGYTAVLWSIDTLDWSQRDKSNIVKNVLDNVRPGDIVLMHSKPGQIATVQALPEIIKGLRERGYRLVTLSELLGVPGYK